jgi:hypothetical protein
MSNFFEAIDRTWIGSFFTLRGALFLVIFAMLVVVSAALQNHSNNNLLNDPKKGDLYITMIGDNYSAFKLAKVNGDSLFVEIGQFSRYRSRPIGPLYEEERFAPGVWRTRDDVQKMYETNVVEIIR